MSAEIKRQMFEIIKNHLNGGDYKALKDSIMPPRFYKYFRPDENALQSLMDKYVWKSSPERFNDPFDSMVGFIRQAEFNRDPREQALVNRNISTTTKVCCLSEVNNSILMWSHYAQNHQGFCFEYDLSDPRLESDMVSFYPVHYSEDILDLNECLRLGQDAYGISILASIVKHIDWSYEKEWRFFDFYTFGGSNKQSVNDPTAIYFGAKSNPGDPIIVQVLKIAAERSIPIFRMVQSTDRFGLEPIIATVNP
jgi:hypothetical protein